MTTEYLIEMAGADPASGKAVTAYFSASGFATLPTDTPANTYYAQRVKVPGNYERALFGAGTTSGDITVGVGLIELSNMDGKLDYLRNLAFDGYPLRILSLAKLNARYDAAVLVFSGTVEQVELQWDRATIRIRDRLAELAKPLQTVTYTGTTVSGGMSEAEGKPEDLKGQRKPTLWGAPAQVPGVLSNPYDLIYDLADNGFAGVTEVRDKGVLLTATGRDYPTTAALIAATVPSGQYATCKAKGQIGLGLAPLGQISAAPVEAGGEVAQAQFRTAAQVAGRMLKRMGLVEGVSYLASDIAALDALNAAPVGYWTGTDEVTALDSVAAVLGSIGAMITPDRLGVFRMLRFGAPVTEPEVTLTATEILETASGRGFQLLATGDEGKGVPAWKVTVKYARNWAVQTRNDLQTATSDAFKSFAELEWRLAVADAPHVKAIHKLAPELTFETYLIHEADALAEAKRRLALHLVKRDRLRVPVKSSLVQQIDLGDVVRVKVNRFGLNDGKSFVVIGLVEDLQTGVSTLDLWG